MKSVLNVGGSTKQIPIPDRYRGWKHDLLDVDPRFGVDVVMDARKLDTLPPATYDAIYCSHTLEHFTARDAMKVVRGFLHLLRDDGFLEIRVPDFQAAGTEAIRRGVDLADTLYTINGFAVSLRHVIYGHHEEVAQSGTDYWAHKNVFTAASMRELLTEGGFATIVVAGGDATQSDFDIAAFAFKTQQPPERVEQVLRGDS